MAGLFYAVSVLFFKRALLLGLGPWRCIFIMNVSCAIIFSPVMLFGGPFPPILTLWPTLVAGTLFFAGSIFNTLAITRGDVSLATPIMGFKPVFVAILAASILGERLDWKIWAACFLSVVGITLMQGGFRGLHTSALRQTVFYALGSAMSYALCDIVVQHYALGVGKLVFFPLVCIVCALYSLVLIPHFRGGFQDIPPIAWKWLAIAISLALFVNGGIYVSIAFFQDATGTNIVYSGRGVFSVLIIWWIGHHFDNHEARLGGGALMGKRLLGAMCTIIAVIFAMT